MDRSIRNIFAMTTLEEQQMVVLSAENGLEAIERLASTPSIDVVPMDMMPEMDGYDTTRAMRANNAFQALPIIAVTAKAMKGGAGKCLEAGVTDCIAKPVDPEQLFSMLGFWLHR